MLWNILFDKVDTQCRNSFDEKNWEMINFKSHLNLWYGWYQAKSVNDGIFTASMLHLKGGTCQIDMALLAL